MNCNDFSELEGPAHILGRLKAPNGFRLARGEYFCHCPYDESHVVLNTRFDIHLFKCRRNFVKKITDNGKKDVPLPYSYCRYNSSHYHFPPESRYHDDTCPERWKRLIPSRYVKTGVYNSATMSTTRPVYVNNAKMASAANSAAKTKAKPIDTMTTKLARPVSLLSFGRELYASANTPHEFSFEGIPDDEGVLIPEVQPVKETPTMTERDIYKYQENLKRMQREDPNFDISTYEDWDIESMMFPRPGYDPMATIIRYNRSGMNPPPGLSKGDKKAFYKEQRERYDYMYNDNDPTI